MITGNKREALAVAATLLLPSVVILVALWLPFGFAMTGLIEEWDLLGLFAIFGPFLTARLDGPLAPHGLRPLMPMSFDIAYLIGRDSFIGWHLLTLAALLVKGGAMTYLVNRATGSRAWGVVAAVLLLLYPADTMQLSFRSIHINVALALSLAGCALLVRALEARRTTSVVATAVAASVLYLAGIAIYEVALMLIALPLAVQFVRSGWRRRMGTSRARLFAVAAPWLASAVIYVGYAAWLVPKIASYQGSVTGDKKSLLATAYGAWPQLFTVGSARALIGGWIDAARMVATEYASFVYLMCSALIVALVIVLAIRFDQRSRATPPGDSTESWAMSARLVVAGAVLMLMGYAPFLTSAAHLAISQRTFLWATPGAVLVWVGLLLALWRLARAPAAVTLLALLVLGLGGQLFQFHHYVNLSERQRSVLRAIVEGSDAVPQDKTLLVLDRSNQLGHTWLFPGTGLFYALSYLHGHGVGPVEVCRTSSMEWQRVDLFNRKGTCVEDNSGWTFSPAPSASAPGVAATVPESHRLAKEHVVVVEISADGSTVEQLGVADRRRRLQTGMETIDRRYRGILAPRADGPIRPMFRDQFVSERYRWDFGDWWNLDVPQRGVGWREAEWLGNGLSRRSGAWKTGATADLHFELAPAAHSYVVRGRFDQFSGETIRNSLNLRMNGQPLPLRWVSEFDFQADVPVGLPARGVNSLEFVSDLNSQFFGFSMWLDWVEVSPR